MAASSCRYRIGHFVEQTTGADAVVGPQLPRKVAEQLHTLVCVRPQVTPNLERALRDLRRRGVRVLADYDDLLFAGDVSGLPNSVGGPGNESARQRRLDYYARALEVFDGFIVATRPLAQHLAVLAPGKPVALVPNGLSASWVTQGRALYPLFSPADPRTIRYFAGSPSHDLDIASIGDPLAVLMRRHPEVRLELVGHVRIDTSRLPTARVTHLPSVSYDELPRLLGSSWINLAPLVPSAFGACRSAIKFLEAAAFACPTLASPNDDMLRHQQLGGPVIICETEQDWLRELEAMLDLERRASVAAQGERHIVAHGLAKTHLPEWLAAIRSQAVRS